MVIKINYTSSDVYVSTSVSPVYVVVNYSGTTTGAAVWGQITGTLSNQTDLQTALDDKVPYTGATANVDLGGFSIKPSMVQITGINSGGTGGVLNLKKGNTRVIGGDDAANNISLWAETGAFGFNDWTAGNTRDAKFSLLSITNNATRTYTLPNLDGTLALLSDITPGLTSVGLSMPSAFAVSNSPLTSNGTIAVTGAGTASQYVRGDGQLATLPSGAGGGSSVNYYLNGSVNQGTIGGSVYYEMNRIPVIGTGTDFTRTNLQGDGLIAQFITDANDPNRLEIPAGAWNFEMYFNVSSAGGTPAFYLELLKYDGTTFTSISNGSTNPETITGGTAVDLYLSSLAVPQTTLLATDRLAIRVYVITSGRNITLHTEDNNLCEIITTFAGGVASLNGLTANTQYFATGTSGTDFAISSATDTHTFNLPTASAINRGALSSADWNTFSAKVGGSGASGQVAYWNGTSSQTGSSTFVFSPISQLLVNNSVTAASAIARGINLTPTLTASANNDVLVGLDVNPTFTNGAFTGVKNWSVRLPNTAQIGVGTSSTYTFYLANGETAINSPGGFVGIQLATNNVARFFGATGNLLLQNGGTFTDGGQRLQVQGTSFFSDSLGIGSTTLTGYGLRVSKTITGSIISGGIYNDGQVQSDVTSSVRIYRSQLNIVNSVFTISDVYHYIAEQGTIGASSSVTNQYGYITGNLTKGTNNYGFYGTISAATNRWNLYMEGTADNYLAGKLLIGTTTDAGEKLQVNGNIYITSGVVYGASSYSDAAVNKGMSFVGTNVLFNNGGERMRLTSGGNLLVGTTTDAGQKLQVSGNVSIGASSATTVTSTYNSTTRNRITYTNSSSFEFFEGANERMRLAPASGNLLVGTTTDIASSKVTIESTTQGFLPPRMTNAQRTAISSPAVGLIVYCTDATEGLYQYTSAGWANLNGVVTNRQTASYTLALTDINNLVEMNVATANNLTVPLNSSVAFPIGTNIDIAQYGAGQTTVVATSGVTVRSAGGALKLAVQYSGATLVKIANDEWYLFGDITV